ncbi:hypothetical protein ACFRKB_21115 [Streptomyces scopuliridis]|uniref:hypothetical protein n=1 Tax=Streptomyces scopuliridis TaxID=452529 RepID=UPI003691C03A
MRSIRKAPRAVDSQAPVSVRENATVLPEGSTPEWSRKTVLAETRPVWKKLKVLPRAEQLSPINAMRAAALSCEGDAFDALKGGVSG